MQQSTRLANELYAKYRC